MVNNIETDYTLAASEFTAVQSLLLFQEQFRLDAPAATVDEYCTGLDSLLDAYGQVKNSIIKSWFDAMFTYANDTETLDPGSGIYVPMLQTLWHYAKFCNRDVVLTAPENWKTCWEAFVKGRTVLVDAVGGGLLSPGQTPTITKTRYPVGPFKVPTIPETWNTSVTNKINASDPNLLKHVENSDERFQINCCIPTNNNMTLENAVHCTPNYYNQMKLLNSWNNVGTVAQHTAQAATSLEYSCVIDLLNSDSNLKPGDYFFMLHALIALAVTTTNNPTLAQTIVNTPASSDEYQNEVFINQLIYISLMCLVDPLGNYAMDNISPKDLLGSLHNLITATDAASNLIKGCLNSHVDILRNTPDYPTVDPETSIEYPTRVNDTLAALERARKLIKASLIATSAKSEIKSQK